MKLAQCMEQAVWLVVRLCPECRPCFAALPSSPADSNLLLMDDTSLENTFSCQPQTRNVHGRVFGGFLMR
jgi:acyl-coenzyme A thioesterase PaaI-like protein